MVQTSPFGSRRRPLPSFGRRPRTLSPESPKEPAVGLSQGVNGIRVSHCELSSKVKFPVGSNPGASIKREPVGRSVGQTCRSCEATQGSVNRSLRFRPTRQTRQTDHISTCHGDAMGSQLTAQAVPASEEGSARQVVVELIESRDDKKHKSCKQHVWKSNR